MATALQIETRERTEEITRPVPDVCPFFSIRDLAERWRCSRGSVYSRIRGEMVVDFAAKGKKGPPALEGTQQSSAV
jgi:hypothetical protein